MAKIRTLNKLARNNIHENLALRGATAVTRILSDEEYKQALFNKLQEEVAEFLKEPITEELADIQEVINALVPLIAGTQEEFEKIRKEKFKFRGGYDKKIFLYEIHEKE